MKSIVLSDHTGDMIADQQMQRQQQYDSEMARYRSESASRARRVQQMYDSQMSAYESELKSWRGKNWMQKLGYGISKSWMVFLLCIALMGASAYISIATPEYWLMSLLIPAALVFMALFFPTRGPKEPSREEIRQRWPEPARPRQAATSNEQHVWQAGSEGEHRVSAYLSSQLNDDWTLISGYRGPGGEIDQILVGPRGVCALETKYLNGTVFVRGDTWKLDKYDNYGNLVESGEAVEDRGGRSPSAQVNGAVKPLQTFLSKRNQVNRVGRAVILAHDKSAVGKVEGQTVDHIGTLSGMNVDSLFPRSGTGLDRASAESVVQHIQRDHEFHKTRSKRRGRRSGRPRRRSHN